MPSGGLDVHELDYLDRFLIGLIGSDATCQALLGTTADERAANIFRVWTEVMPEGSPYPGVVLGYQAGADTVANGRVRIVSRPIYLIKACTIGDSYAQAAAIATAVGQAVEGASGSLGAVKIGGGYRQSPFRMHIVRAGVRYNFVGGTYRFFVSK